MSANVFALILASAASEDVKITGLTLSERARRVARMAGVAPERIYLARSGAEVSALASVLTRAPLLVVRADGFVVAAQLVEPLRLAEPGNRRAVDERDEPAGAIRVDAEAAPALLEAVAADFAAVDRAQAEPVRVNRRARHPARTPEERRAADDWQFELTIKPLDAPIVRYFYRPLAKPLTRLFLNSPFTPNAISILSILLSLGGCAIAAGRGYAMHAIGLGILVLGGVVDANDGEVARLRLEGSKLGAWLDAIGDDLARLALVLAVGAHTATRWPEWPLWPLALAATGLTVATLALIYWYCIFVAGTTNNQEYGLVLGVGPGATGERSFIRRLGDVAALIARRDMMDIGVWLLAIVNLPEVSYAALVIGSVVGFAIVLPTHFKLVKLHSKA